MQSCEGCDFVNPWNAPYDRRNHKWLKSICYCCDNSADNKPRTISKPVIEQDITRPLAAQLQAQINYIGNKLNTHVDKKRGDYY